MKKKSNIIKLTESQLNEIILKVIEEQGFSDTIKSLGTGFGNLDSLKNTSNAQPKENINPKNLKFGDGGKSSPNLKNDVIALQSALMKAGKLKIKAPTGYFGEKTKAALDAYNGAPTTGASQGKQNPNSGFILIWAFPEYQPKIDGKGGLAQFFGSFIRIVSGGGKDGTYGKLGHGGCVIVKKDGTCILHEFGRYPGADKNYGKVLTTKLGKIGQIQNGKLVNAGQIASRAKVKTYPPGPTMQMKVAVVTLPNPDGAESYASVKQREYSAMDFFHGGAANCGTYARDVAEAGGVNAPNFCFPNPNSVVESFRSEALEMFTV